MAYLSIFCGFIGLSGIYFFGKKILLFILHSLLESTKIGYYTLIFQYNTKNQIVVFAIFLFLSLVILFLAFIFGKKSIKKYKNCKNYWIGFIGYIQGWIGILLVIISILTFIIYNIINLFFIITNKTIISQNIFPYGIENLPNYNVSILLLSLSYSISISILLLSIALIKFVKKEIKKRERKIDILA